MLLSNIYAAALIKGPDEPITKQSNGFTSFESQRASKRENSENPPFLSTKESEKQ